jgi:hypothetical protein
METPMAESAASGDAVSLQRLFNAVERSLKRNNVVFLMSACLMLFGCYRVCAPYLMQKMNRTGLLALPAVMNIYEVMVLCACGFIIRKALGLVSPLMLHFHRRI